MPKLTCPGLHHTTPHVHMYDQRPVHQASAARQTDMKLPILHPGPDRPAFLQTFSYSSFRRSCWRWRSAAGGPVGRTMVEPVWQGAFTPWHQTQQRAHPGHSATPTPPLITSPSVSPCLQFRHVPVFLLSCLSLSFCLRPTKTAIQRRRWWAGGKMPRLHRSSAAGTAPLSVAD